MASRESAFVDITPEVLGEESLMLLKSFFAEARLKKKEQRGLS